jgi:pyruvate formate lyase activating enzyme
MSQPLGQACALCGARAPQISARLGFCVSCLRSRPEDALPLAEAAHVAARRAFSLPTAPPQTAKGIDCPLCARGCRIGGGERGFCAQRTVQGGQLLHLAGTPDRGRLSWYRDALPTNCVADWVCAGHERSGDHNLAVFYESCTLDCLFCQNWHFREALGTPSDGLSADALADVATGETFCVCFFGGDPAAQMPHALAAAKRLAARGVRVCWETAGTSHPRLLDQAVELSLETGGCIKFDLKAHDHNLHLALTGASNERTLDNFRRAAGRAAERPDPPLAIASTLLVPGYVDADEVGRIARLIAEVDPSTPYALLGFFPHFHMSDLPRTSLEHAEAARAAALEAGLANVRLANTHLFRH